MSFANVYWYVPSPYRRRCRRCRLRWWPGAGMWCRPPSCGCARARRRGIRRRVDVGLPLARHQGRGRDGLRRHRGELSAGGNELGNGEINLARRQARQRQAGFIEQLEFHHGLCRRGGGHAGAEDGRRNRSSRGQLERAHGTVGPVAGRSRRTRGSGGAAAGGEQSAQEQGAQGNPRCVHARPFRARSSAPATSGLPQFVHDLSLNAPRHKSKFDRRLVAS